VHAGKAAVAALQEADLVPVSDVVTIPRAPVIEFAIAILLLAASAIIAITGVASPDRTGNLPPGAVTVAGVDPTTDAVAKIDLDQPIVVAGTLPQSAASANQVALGFSAAGVSLGQAKTPITPGPDGKFSATFKTSGSKYLIAGRATGKVELNHDASVLANQSFGAKSTQPAYLTVPGVIMIASLLFIAGYPASILRGMRRGRKKVTGTVGLTILGGLFGVFVVCGMWLFGGKEPVSGTLAASVVVGMLGGFAAGLGGLQLGRRRRPVQVQPQEQPAQPQPQR